MSNNIITYLAQEKLHLTFLLRETLLEYSSPGRENEIKR